MCCFSRPIDSVTKTNIFARPAAQGRQYLVYSMFLSTKEDVAMILPLPTPPKPPENAVRFLSLKEYPQFFRDMKRGFPEPASRAVDATRRPPRILSKKLEVVEVGEFEASFVPTVADFDRLDERFRLPPGTWDQLPAYRDYGFAVFKLKPGAKTIHPMAFEFPRANPEQMFFPTVHIHDGKVHARASFDHALYCQPGEMSPPSLVDWRESVAPASQFIQIAKTLGIVAGDRHCYQRVLVGKFENRDIVI